MKTIHLESLEITLTSQEVEGLVEEFRILRINSNFYEDLHQEDSTCISRLESTLKDYSERK
jgi:hypothetical protein